MAKNRKYNYSDVIMCMASKTIAGSFKSNLSELSTARTNWTSEYADGLNERIDDAIKTHLGVDAKKELRNASGILSSLAGPAKRDLAFFKTQVDEDFRAESKKRKEILTTIGLSKNLEAVQKGDQEALIEMLYAFKKNMTDQLKLDITAKGMNPVLIDNIIGYADGVAGANIDQEGFKETTKEISSEVTSVFNAIYVEVIGICKIASDFYQYEPLKKEQFTFSKIAANMDTPKKKGRKPKG